MCPADDSFLTSSVDRTVRLWTAGVAGCIAELKLPEETEGSPLAAFDSTGLVFAVTAAMLRGAGHYLHLYDARRRRQGANSKAVHELKRRDSLCSEKFAVLFLLLDVSACLPPQAPFKFFKPFVTV